MSELLASGMKISVHQRDPSPAWVDFRIDGKTYTFLASEFMTFVAWLKAESKGIKSDEKILKEIRRRGF